MAVLESYSPCPCGSGQKYKWCCQKAEAYAHKSARLQDSGAIEPAKAALDEGLAKFPDNPWLTIRKAILLARQQKTKEAGAILQRLVAKEPGHPGAQNFLVRATLETEGTSAAAAQLQAALSAVTPENRPALAMTAQVVGMLLIEEGHVPAALAHLGLAEQLAPDDEDLPLGRSQRMLLGNAAISAWLRDPYSLAHAPASLAGDQAETFALASTWAEEGLWASAAAAFDTLAASGVAEADRNAGLCRLRLADDAGAVASMRRYLATPGHGDSTEAADLEALCQILAPAKGGDLVGHVQLIWTIRDREGLLKRLRDDPAVSSEGPGPIDETDPKSPEVEWFALLDRAKPASVAGLDPREIPRVEARVSVGREIAALDVVDDGRLERLRDRLTDVAGPTLPPAHPRTKSLGPVPRASVALDVEMWLPEGVDRDERARITESEQAWIIREVWPVTPMPYLKGRSPRQAAKDGNASLALRAALNQFAFGQEFWRGSLDFAALRNELGVGPEPPIDPATVDVESLHISRLHLVPVEGLSDEKLVDLFDRAHGYVLPLAMENAARALVERPAIFENGLMDRVVPYADMANLALARRAPKDEVFGWVARGRHADRTAINAVRWDFLELRLRARSEPPEAWVPQLAVILERYAEDRASSSAVMSNLLDMGLVRTSPNPDDRGQMLLDTRPLQAVLSQYGPKITTATGRLGVSATQGGVWTPGGSAAGGGGAIWTPGGATSQAGGDKPKLIIPGR